MSKSKKKSEKKRETESESSSSRDSDSASSSSSSQSSSSTDSGGKIHKKSTISKVCKKKSSESRVKPEKRVNSESDSDSLPAKKTRISSLEHEKPKEKQNYKRRRDDSRGRERRPSPERGYDPENTSKWDSPVRDRHGNSNRRQDYRGYDRRQTGNVRRRSNSETRRGRDESYNDREDYGNSRNKDSYRGRRNNGSSYRHGENRWRNDERDRNDDRKYNNYRHQGSDRDDDRNRERGRNVDNRYKGRQQNRGRQHSRSRSPRKPHHFKREQEDDAKYEWGNRRTDQQNKDEDNNPIEKEKPNMELTGKLTEDTNTVNGVVVKYSEPPEARKPKRRWRLYPFKGEKALPTLHIHRQSCFLVGRDRKVCDLAVDHPSCSKQHAALQYRLVPFEREDGTVGRRVRPYIIDLESANGTFLNSKKIDPRRYIELMEKDVLKFGFSSREYVLLHENSKEEQDDDDVKQEDEGIEIKEEPA